MAMGGSVQSGGSGGTSAGSGGTPTGLGGTTSGTGGVPGDSGGGSVTDAGMVPLIFDTGGFVSMMSNTLGIQGAFYGYGDGQSQTAPNAGNCQTAGHTTCSTNMVAIDANTQTICATGIAAQVIGADGGPPDYSGIFGAGIGVDLNNPGGDAGVKMGYNAMSHGVVGIGFTLTPAPGSTTAAYGSDFRVEFPATGQDSIGANLPARYNMVTPGSTTVDSLFSTARVFYLNAGAGDGEALDTTAILSIQWHVATNVMAAIPFNYCLSNIQMLTQ